MRSIVVPAILLALTIPAHASSAAEWTCGQGFKVVSTRGDYFLDMGKATPIKGSLTLTWDLRRNKFVVNGKPCKLTN